jgi:hypothetical protein
MRKRRVPLAALVDIRKLCPLLHLLVQRPKVLEVSYHMLFL